MSGWFNRLFGRFRKTSKQKTKDEEIVDQGFFYFYLIVGSQVIFIFGLLGVIVGIGSVLATPWWIFVFAFLLGMGGCLYIYRKVKMQIRKFRDAIQKVDISDRNYEISVMGGFLTMRVEQNPQRLLENNTSSSVLDAETVER